MVVKLSQRAFDHARKMIKDGHVVIDERDAWSEHQPATQQENEFIEKHGYGEYGKWHLGIGDEKRENTKGRYKVPYGDFENVHRCGSNASSCRRRPAPSEGRPLHVEPKGAVSRMYGAYREGEGTSERALSCSIRKVLSTGATFHRSG